jgi:hypothetical protein
MSPSGLGFIFQSKNNENGEKRWQYRDAKTKNGKYQEQSASQIS